MKYFFFFLCTLSLSLIALLPIPARAERVDCPVVVDRETGKYSVSKSKYRCYNDSRSARRAGFSRHSFDDDDASCTPGGGDGNGGSADLTLSGPGQKRSIVFNAPTGGTVTFNFPGGGEFGVDVYNAATDRRIERVIETESAVSNTLPFSGQSFPIQIKVEGPGTWTAGIEIN